jgi:2-isopropylmalate synthase
MRQDPASKYQFFQPIDLPDRQWPARRITEPPLWASVDLRDGNQALIEPMGHERKLRMFHALVEIGFKQIEIGFPSASETDYDFTRYLIENDEIPDDVTVQVLTQAREELIQRTFDSLRGAPRAIVHLYNSTSTAQRRVVFDMSRDQVKAIAVDHAKIVRDQAGKQPDTDWVFQYSPESFTGTELDYAVDVCEGVMDVWQPTPDNKVILNLPATVEMATPNVYADQIEWFLRNIRDRESIILSLHPHNDRGTAVAAAELAQMAGADRVEGTLFGNGERTGNVDVVTLAMNLYSQGIDPGLDFSDMNEAVRLAEHCNQLPVHPRHPYAGELVFTAFSGSHQDAIRKGFAEREEKPDAIWDVPYLPIDPRDLGRTYEAVIRVNSQSGKAGSAYLLDTEYGLKIPKRLQIEFSKMVQRVADESGKELTGGEIWNLFEREYLNAPGPLSFREYSSQARAEENGRHSMDARIAFDGQEKQVRGHGNGPISAFMDGVNRTWGLGIEIVDYSEHARGEGADADAVAFVEAQGENGPTVFGCGIHSDIITASLHAAVSAANRVLSAQSGEDAPRRRSA